MNSKEFQDCINYCHRGLRHFFNPLPLSGPIQVLELTSSVLPALFPYFLYPFSLLELFHFYIYLKLM